MDAKPIHPKHILGIDLIRFLAALLVILFHFCYLMGVRPGGVLGVASRQLVAFPELYDFSFFGWVGVEIFFVISGFVIAFSGEKASPFSFFSSRVVRLGPGVWICTPITMAVVLALGHVDYLVLLKQFIRSVFFIPFGPWVDAAQWTLGIEIMFYGLVFLIIVLGDFWKIRPMAMLVGLTSSILAFGSLSGFGGEVGTLVNLVEQSRIFDLLLFQHGLYFALGVFLWLAFVKKTRRSDLVWCVIFAVAGCAKIVASVNGSNAYYGSSYSPIIVCGTWLAGVLGIIASVRWNYVLHCAPPWMLQAIKTAGLMTYPVYLLHSVAGATIMGWMVANGGSRWAALGAGVILPLLASWLICTRIEPHAQRGTRAVLAFARERVLAARIGRGSSELR